ncbi:MAG: adenylosuccinate synthase [Bacteroidetes bacterium HGW-Bacteroidetes-4]|jgi:adenylosuccinate synthase|nr:MAG: adenylosuccinate synthase [Bacteroidetes bacterium HGW-Bacteroidetes-4]
MKVDVLLGLQWGDEGKGKIVDVLTPNYQVVTRFQGGANAGHSLEFNNMKHVLHLIPSGIFHQNTKNIIGNGVVLDPVIFRQEVLEIESKFGIDVPQRLSLAKKANLILPTHKILDGAMEQSKGASKIGSTLKGIGPAYTDKAGRNALRVGDILQANFREKYETLKALHVKQLSLYNFDYQLEALEAEWFESIEFLKRFSLIDSEQVINQYIREADTKILAEGAQGSMLDIDFGSYPFVTSSNTICAGACTGMGIAPHSIGGVLGIFKAYCTRVGSGPFPTELFDETGQKLRDIGHEYGATTGRPRRCGWLDLVALKYSVMLNGVTGLIMTKADVLDSFETLKVAVAYKINGEICDYFPYDIEQEIEPVYREFKGWKCDITCKNSEADLPVELMNYIRFIESETGVPVTIVSVGPDRDATILR